MRTLALFSLVAALLVAAAAGRAVRSAHAVVPVSGQFETEHVSEDWRFKWLGASSRVEENSCGSPDKVAPLGDSDRTGGIL